MKAKIRPLTDSSYTETYGLVSKEFSRKSPKDNTTEDTRIFGDDLATSSGTDYYTDGTYCRRGYIQLAIPVLNFFASGWTSDKSGSTNIEKIIGKGIPFKEIVTGSVVYDSVAGKVYHASDNIDSKPYRPEYLIGGDYIRRIIDNLDIDELIYEEIDGIVKKALSNQSVLYRGEQVKANKVENLYEVTEGSGEYWIVDNFYVTLSAPLVQPEDFKKKLYDLAVASVSQHLSPLALRLRVRTDKSRVRNLIMDKLMVLPIGYRPMIENRMDPISKGYNSIIRANNELQMLMSMSSSTVYQVRSAYQALVKSVQQLTINNENNLNNKKMIPLAEKLTQKSGHIRSMMQGVRSDYTGRTVITVDPKMSIDTIGVPKRMLIKLLQLDLLDFNRNSQNKCMSLRDIDLDNAKLDAKLRDILTTTYLPIGRQPTLYKHAELESEIPVCKFYFQFSKSLAKVNSGKSNYPDFSGT